MIEETNAFKKKDRTRIDANDKFEVEYLHQQYPWYTYQQITEVIKTAGPFYARVDKELRLRHVSNASTR